MQRMKWKRRGINSVYNVCLFVCRFDFKGIIDYIFYSKQSMTPLGLLGPLSADWFREHKIVGCPHPHIPSGNKHLTFIFDFTVICTGIEFGIVQVKRHCLKHLLNCSRSLPVAGGAGDGPRQLSLQWTHLPAVAEPRPSPHLHRS